MVTPAADFWGFVRFAREHPRCTRVVLCSNGVSIPRTTLRQWLDRLGAPLTLKLSINHHLLERDAGLLDLARALAEAFDADARDRALVLNVRRRRGAPDDDRWVIDAVEAAGLLPWANDFFLQRYGMAENETQWDPPFLVGHDFRMVNPDGAVIGPDLLARSEGMRELP